MLYGYASPYASFDSAVHDTSTETQEDKAFLRTFFGRRDEKECLREGQGGWRDQLSIKEIFYKDLLSNEIHAAPAAAGQTNSSNRARKRA